MIMKDFRNILHFICKCRFTDCMSYKPDKFETNYGSHLISLVSYYKWVHIFGNGRNKAVVNFYNQFVALKLIEPFILFGPN